jgi:hypothetical protein
MKNIIFIMNKNLANNLKRLYKKQKNDKFNEWLNKCVDSDLFNKDVVNEFIIEITNLLKKKGYEINDKNQFKNAIATYIYLESI